MNDLGVLRLSPDNFTPPSRTPWGGRRILDELKLRVRAASGPGGMADYFHILLMEGGLKKVVEIVDSRPELLADLLPIVGNPDASMNVSLGASAAASASSRGSRSTVISALLSLRSRAQQSRRAPRAPGSDACEPPRA